MVSSYRLMDLGFQGPMYTWCNNRKVGSDHLDLVVDTEGGAFRDRRPFIFESIWFNHPECKSVAISTWGNVVSGNPSDVISQKLELCQSAYTTWNKVVFGNVQSKIKKYLHELEQLQLLPSSDLIHDQIVVTTLLDLELANEEELWHQKSRQLWLKGGDKNTSFFHASTIQRRQMNRILKSKRPSGSWTESENEIYQEFLNHFNDAFSSEGIDESALLQVLSTIELKISRDTNEQLCKLPSLKRFIMPSLP
ncbi:uncharacterized protein LOC122086898 [Macadamia integrifolia]|uniref:uncharacterized protein LOC122086898 n=1 Tax=Macadamia integrifolia TaxID=60698 RepID=UPI001C4E4042|nr:uncharacterized protein LOC122086898 [Macadamia integrifolia]